MDEHDKRAREVVEKVLHALTSGDPARAAGASDLFASALRSTAAAAVAAERERAARVCEEIGTEEGETPGEALDRAADAIRAAPSRLWTENAERQLARNGGWHVPGPSASPAPLASPAQAERVSEDGYKAYYRRNPLPEPALDETDATLSALARLLNCNNNVHSVYEHVRDAVQGRAAARADVAAAHSRIAARLRARADEEQEHAEGFGSGTGPNIRHHHAALVLRAEADALEVGT